MGGTGYVLAVAQFSHPCGERAATPESLAALPELAGTFAVLCCGLLTSSGLYDTISANPKRLRLAQVTTEPTGFVNQVNVRAAKAIPITASQAQHVRRDVVRQGRVDHRRGSR